MFEKASRLNLRFESPKGMLTTEDLWDLPLISPAARANLDDIARALFNKLKTDNTVSFVIKERKSDDVTQLQFDIVKHIIDVRLAENEAAAAAKANKEKVQSILAIIAQKETEQVAGKSLEELRAMVASMQQG